MSEPMPHHTEALGVSGRALRIRRQFDRHGAPVPEEIVQPIAPTSLWAAHSVAIREMTTIGARFAGDGGFEFADPQRGSGRIEFIGFDQDELERIVDHFRIEAVRLQLGLPAALRPALDPPLYKSNPGLRNPVFFILAGAMVIVLSLVMILGMTVGPLRGPGGEVVWGYWLPFAVLGVFGIGVIVWGARRVRGRSLMRGHFQSRGEPMPRGLRTFE